MIFYKFPFQESIYTIKQENQQTQVSFVPFDRGEVLHFQGTAIPILCKEDIRLSTIDLPHGQNTAIEPESENDYLDKISTVIEFIKAKELKKLVIARQKKIPYTSLSPLGAMDLPQSFLNLCQAYPNAFVYLFLHKKTCWMGAFSELLGKYIKKTSEFQTMALAGTLPLEEAWTEKEIEEQKPVTKYIEAILRQYSKQIYISETYSHFSGNIKHLRTDFQCRIQPKDLEHLISQLHPTPAVCGIPKKVCMEAIKTFENFDRSYYSGYIRIETDKEILYFVNLRCAEFTKKHATIYIGGGITPKSLPEKEWKETELKSEAIVKSLCPIF